MRVLWGPEFIFLYNDSYRPILGASKHPSAMGSRTAESFRELWHVVGPLFHRVYAGEAIALVDTLLPLDRNGYLEECYFTLSYSPLLDDDGKIGGVLGVVHETTETVVASRRLRTSETSPRAPRPLAQRRPLATGRPLRSRKIPLNVPFALFYVRDLGRPSRAPHRAHRSRRPPGRRSGRRRAGRSGRRMGAASTGRAAVGRRDLGPRGALRAAARWSLRRADPTGDDLPHQEAPDRAPVWFPRRGDQPAAAAR